MIDLYQISRKVHDWMEKNLDRKSRVLELGGGRGSKRLQNLFPNSLTIEHDPHWVGHLLRASCRVMHRPLVDGWFEIDDELREEIRKADVILIDGPPGYLRSNFEKHWDLLSGETILIIDDTHRAKVRRMVKDEIIAIIHDDRRMTHITKSKRDAKNPDKGEAESLDRPKPKRRRRKAISKPEMEKISEVVSHPESDLHSMPKSSDDL